MVARAVLLAALLVGCLPEGGPGIGQKVLPGRGFANMTAGVGQDRPLFFTLPSAEGLPRDALDLYILRPGHPAPELLVHDAAVPLVFDARGRLYVHHTPARHPRPEGQGDAYVYQLRQIDLASGATLELGPIEQLQVSPGATHLVLTRPDRRRDGLTLDGELRPLTAASTEVQFVGEDVCWLVQRRLDCALVEGGPPVHPTDRAVLKLFPLPSTDGKPDILITTVDLSTRPPVEFVQFWRVRLRPGPGEPPETLLGRGRPLGEVVVSDDADWFAFVELPPSGGEPRLRLISAGPPSEATLTLEQGPSDFEDERIASFGWSDPRFRPGRNEVWSLGPGGRLAILRADGTQAVHRPPGGVRRAPDSMEWASGRLSFYPSASEAGPVRNMFSADGRWWVYREGDQIHLGDAGDPAAPSRLQQPRTDVHGVADILGQNRLALWSTGGQQVLLRVYAADTLSPLGAVDEARQAVVGARGTLALTGYQGGDLQSLTPGTLVLGALGANQKPVIIGQNVSQFTLLTGCPTCDPVAPGTRLAYTVHARVPWKHDGLWLADLP
jgi:hypothetical protein